MKRGRKMSDNDFIYSEENVNKIKMISQEMKEGKYNEIDLDNEK